MGARQDLVEDVEHGELIVGRGPAGLAVDERIFVMNGADGEVALLVDGTGDADVDQGRPRSGLGEDHVVGLDVAMDESGVVERLERL